MIQYGNERICDYVNKTKPFLRLINLHIQVNSIAWANNMVEAMMSDSDDEEANRSQERENKRHKSDDDENEQRGSPSKKVELLLTGGFIC